MGTRTGKTLDELRQRLLSSGCTVVKAIFNDIAPKLIPGEPLKKNSKQEKTINDPVWRTIRLRADEIDILDTPLLQRLRRIRQLGLANLVYPGANHTRFEHSLGALEATERIFRQLSETCLIDPDLKERFRLRARMAALLHDCGHGVFSHVSERVLQNLFFEGFQKIQTLLLGFFTEDRINPKPDPSPNPALAPAAELISVLLVISESFERLMKNIGRTPEDVFCIAAIILGKEYGLYNADETCHYSFLQAMVSGDLDADKIDYVARDAYFSGIPIAADIDRLISMLRTVRNVETVGQNGSNLERFLIGVLPSGVPAVEMFVMTRSYLFDRIYCHPKTRAAERLMERRLNTYITREMGRGMTVSDALTFLLCNGDDAILASDLALVKGLENRDIPIRVLAISRRLMLGYEPKTTESLSCLKLLWNKADEKLAQSSRNIESLIKENADLSEQNSVILDWTQRNPIKEDPDIWVFDSTRETPDRVNKYFDAERFSNAYRDMKETAWLFSGAENIPMVAAAATLVIASNFGLIPSWDAYTKAKVKPSDVFAELQLMRKSAEERNDFDLIERVDEIQKVHGENLYLPERFIRERCPSHWLKPDAIAFSKKVASGIENVGFPKSYQEYADRALAVLEMVLLHRGCVLKKGARNKFFENEADFQDDLVRFLCANDKYERGNDITKHDSTASGTTDVVVRDLSTQVKVNIELKVQSRPFEAVIDDWAGQPMQYSSDEGYNRFSILYFQYLSDEPTKESDLIEVRQNKKHGDSPLASFCVGLRQTSRSASKGSLPKKSIPAIEDS